MEWSMVLELQSRWQGCCFQAEDVPHIDLTDHTRVLTHNGEVLVIRTVVGTTTDIPAVAVFTFKVIQVTMVEEDINFWI
jgi:hypothetical protein